MKIIFYALTFLFIVPLITPFTSLHASGSTLAQVENEIVGLPNERLVVFCGGHQVFSRDGHSNDVPMQDVVGQFPGCTFTHNHPQGDGATLSESDIWLTIVGHFQQGRMVTIWHGRRTTCVFAAGPGGWNVVSHSDITSQSTPDWLRISQSMKGSALDVMTASFNITWTRMAPKWSAGGNYFCS
jgi:hypothetical protein